MNHWLLLQSGAGEAAFNMALDEALLEAMPRLGQPVLRFYGWTADAATFGYFQSYSGIASVTGLRPLLRRPTGGGLVTHGADWTYSLTFPVGHEWHSLRAGDSYCRMHAWIQAAFARLGVETELAAMAHKIAPGQCFAGHEKSDLLQHGRKIAGAAQRRSKSGLLIQGSVQPPPGTTVRDHWERAMAEVATRETGVRWQEWMPDMPLRQRAGELVRLKYSQSAYHQQR